MYMKKYVLAILFIYYSFCFSQSAYISYTKENGLPSNTVYCSLQDKDGFMWFGTNRGVSKFDGFNFVNYSIDEGLTDNEVFRIFQDSKSRIWFLTHNAKPCYYLNGKIYNPQNTIFLKKLTTNSFFTNVVETKEGSLLFFKEFSTQLFELRGEVFYEIKSPSIFNHISIYKEDTLIYIFSLLLDENKNKKYVLYRYDKKFIPLDSITDSNTLVCYAKFNNHHVFFDRGISGQEKLIFRNGKTFKNLKKKHLDKIDIEYSSYPNYVSVNDEKLYISTSSGVFVINNRLEVISKLLDKTSSTSITIDYENGVWITTQSKGVYYNPISHCKKMDQIENNVARIITNPYDEQELFILGIGKYYSYNIETQKTINYSINSKQAYWSQEPITDIVFLDKESYIVASSVGVVLVKNNTQYFASNKWKAGIKKILKDNDTIFYARSGTILKQHKKDILAESDYITQLSQIILNKRTYTSCKDIKGNIWFGAIDGIYKIINNQVKKVYLDVNSRIIHISQSKKGYVAFSSDIDGVYIMLSNKNLVHLSTTNGLLSNQVNATYFDDKENCLWVATAKGISKIDSKKFNTIENISAPNGLSDPFINDIIPISDSVIFLATPSGLFELNHKRKIKSPKPFINITQVKVNSQIKELSELQQLSHSENNIEVSFSCISFSSFKNVEFWYSFGADTSNWIKSNTSLLNFSSLSPGKYILSIKGKNLQGIWSDSITIPIAIQKPFYKTLFFYILLMILVFFIFLAYRKKLKKENVINLLLSETKQKALRAQLNPHFIFNALNSIQYLFLSGKEEQAQEYLRKFSTILRNTLNNSDKTYVTLEEELNNLKMYMELEQVRKNEKFKFYFNISSQIDTHNLLIPSMLLQPIAENAIWHGLETLTGEGEIKIFVNKISENYIKIELNDNGIGINKSKQLKLNVKKPQSKGTDLIYERISAFNLTTKNNAEITISDTGNGTSVELILPVKYL